MTPPPHLQIFKPAHVTPKTHLHTFHLFSILPPELRVKIWRLALERQRIIKLCIHARYLMDALLARQGDSRPGTRTQERDGVVVEGYQTCSKLFRVSRESRDVAMAFYRVHLPCWLVMDLKGYGVMKPGTLYFNPVYDFLNVVNGTGQIVDFLHRLKTIHDPRRTGLLNLAVDENALNGGGGLCRVDLSTVEEPVKTSVVETLAQLRTVFFVQEQTTGRHVFGYGSGAPTTDNLLNRSFPIATSTLHFDRLGPDPRSIGEDLRKVFVNSDPRIMISAWRRLLRDALGDQWMPRTEQKVLLTFKRPGSKIFNHMEAKACLQDEQDMWVKETCSNGRPKLVPSEASKPPVEAAFGFWLFPTNAFGALPEGLANRSRESAPRIMDLGEYWPELVSRGLH